MAEEFDYEATRRRFPEHWDKRGWPAFKSTWQSRNYPQLRVRVLETVDVPYVHQGVEFSSGDVRALIYWDGSPDELRGLFTYETDERWNIDQGWSRLRRGRYRPRWPLAGGGSCTRGHIPAGAVRRAGHLARELRGPDAVL